MFRVDVENNNNTVIKSANHTTIPLRDKTNRSNGHVVALDHNQVTKSEVAIDHKNGRNDAYHQLQHRLIFQSEYYNRKLLSMRQEAEIELQLAKWVLETNNNGSSSNKSNADEKETVVHSIETELQQLANNNSQKHHHYNDQEVQLERMRRELHNETNAMKEFHQELVAEFAKKEETLEQEKRNWKREVSDLKDRERELLQEIRELRKSNEAKEKTKNTFANVGVEFAPTTPPPTSSYVRFVMTNSSASVSTTTNNNPKKYLILANHPNRRQLQQQREEEKNKHDKNHIVLLQVKKDRADDSFMETPSPLSTSAHIDERSKRKHSQSHQNDDDDDFDDKERNNFGLSSDDEVDDLPGNNHASPLSPNSLAML